MSVMTLLDNLRTLSARVGADPLLVQAAGGNTSLKDGGTMWIKASGTWLKDAAARDIIRSRRSYGFDDGSRGAGSTV